MKTRRRVEGEQGETLLELIVAIAILGVAVVAIASGIALSVKVSDIHRKQSTASAFLHNFAETLQRSYQDCAAQTPNYAALLATPAGFNAPAANVAYWSGSGFGAVTCPGTPSKDPGLQQVTLTLTSADQRVSESLTVVLRKRS
jgi:type II secretory pathway pseudopilin PulG